MHMVNLIFIAFSVPFDIAFIDTIDCDVFLILECISSFIQLLVIIVNFRTPVFYFGGYTLNFQPVMKNYFANGMIYDLFGLFPINLVLGYL